MKHTEIHLLSNKLTHTITAIEANEQMQVS